MISAFTLTHILTICIIYRNPIGIMTRTQFISRRFHHHQHLDINGLPNCFEIQNKNLKENLKENLKGVVLAKCKIDT